VSVAASCKRHIWKLIGQAPLFRESIRRERRPQRLHWEPRHEKELEKSHRELFTLGGARWRAGVQGVTSASGGRGENFDRRFYVLYRKLNIGKTKMS
jgi:hypothetical protein